MRTPLTSLLVVALLAATAPAQEAPAVPGSETMDRMLDRVTIMQGREYGAITLFPLVLNEGETVEPLGLDVIGPAALSGAVVVRDPKWPARRYNVEFESRGERPVFVLGGTILTGGRLDRMVSENLILEPGAKVEAATLPAEYPRDMRKGKDVADRMDVSSHLAPVYLRKEALFERGTDLVPRFVSHFIGFRQQGDTRNSLQAVSESQDLERGIRMYRDAFGNLPALYEKRVVGWVAVVGGRIYNLELFGSNEMAAAHFPALLRAHAFPTTALRLRAESLGIKLPKTADPERFRPAIDAFLETVRKSERRCGIKPKGTLGASCLLRRSRVRGEVLALNGRLVHAAAIADLPFQDRLYGRPLPPPPGETPVSDFGAMEREDGDDVPNRRLTEFEKRLLERMRSRRPVR
jgi:hypothetical protein